MDFSEFETTEHGTWQLSAVVDYAAKICLACSPSGTQRAEDAVRTLEAAIEEAETLLGQALLDECIDAETGQVIPLVVVTDNGPAVQVRSVCAVHDGEAHLRHVRTKHRAPETNGVVERFFESLKYEHLYGLEIENGHVLAQELKTFRHHFNVIRPHQRLDYRKPIEAYLEPPESNLFEAESLQKS